MLHHLLARATAWVEASCFREVQRAGNGPRESDFAMSRRDGASDSRDGRGRGFARMQSTHGRSFFDTRSFSFLSD